MKNLLNVCSDKKILLCFPDYDSLSNCCASTQTLSHEPQIFYLKSIRSWKGALARIMKARCCRPRQKTQIFSLCVWVSGCDGGGFMEY